MNAADIVSALYRHYAGDYYMCFAELRVGTGHGKDAEQRIDFWCMEAIPSRRFRRIAYEIKVSRSDLLAELRQPQKRRRGLLLSNEFYFVTPPGLVRIDELPPEVGLAEVSHGRLLHKHAAPWRDTIAPTWQFLAACVRRAQRQERNP